MKGPVYKHYTPTEHVLARSAMYVGSCEPVTEVHRVVRDGAIVEAQVQLVPGLYKLFDEVLVNAYDQCVTDPTVKKIQIDVGLDHVRVINDGRGIAIEKDRDTGVWNPHLIFGMLHTSSNYDDTEERVTGGMNGLGAKLANLLSTRFVVECTYGDLKYRQEFEDNMRRAHDPKITRVKPKNTHYVSITFYPDLARFGVEDLSGMRDLFHRRACDVAAMVHARVVFNGDPVKVKDFAGYATMILGPKTEAFRAEFGSDAFRVVVAESARGFQHLSFVNGVATHLGGTHVDHATNAFIKAVLEHVQSIKKLAGKVRSHQIKDRLFVLIRAQVANPTFSSQTKDLLTTPATKFRDRVEVPDRVVKQFLKQTTLLAELENSAAAKDRREIARTDGAKTQRVHVDKLDDANLAGTRHSSRCTLIVTEGDSAKTFAIAGLSVVGRDLYGVFPLKGKLLNTRDASTKQLLQNDEINNLKTILGLKQGKRYENLSSLRYGKLMILTDADVDGLHITGLIQNFIESLFPGLLELGFVCAMRTAIIKATKGATTLSYFSEQKYLDDRRDGRVDDSWKIKYYKGLGTSGADEARSYFRDLEANVVHYRADPDHRTSLVKAFDKKRADDRKQWILDNTGVRTHPERNETITDFVNHELVTFSIYDVHRSIPSVVDGLKPSQRKILYTCFQRKLVSEIKVAQLSGAVAELSHYHHGEASLTAAIVAMAQNFVGSNQINLLEPVGMFGTRLMGGKDAASARYIFTHLRPVTRTLFPETDDRVLRYVKSDGVLVEPEYYVPVIPMVLVNGATGIGTGFATSVPTYPVADVLENTRRCARGEAMRPMIPQFEGFHGTIREICDRPGTFAVEGAFRAEGEGFRITELPLGDWTQTFLAKLDATGLEYKNDSTEERVDIWVRGSEDAVRNLVPARTVSTRNMVLFDPRGKIKKYETPLEIIADFVSARRELYHARKEYQLNVLAERERELGEKIRFVRGVIEGAIRVFRVPAAEVRAQLQTQGFANVASLVDTPIKDFTREKIERLEAQHRACVADLEKLRETEPLRLWEHDLETLHKLTFESSRA